MICWGKSFLGVGWKIMTNKRNKGIAYEELEEKYDRL
jgi:hypothetical protein